ncbi:MAG: DUF1385 domain-containing protein [Clostridia bacterium]|nr:DUF1385 domain-containing protein [Clostridia bacterium]
MKKEKQTRTCMRKTSIGGQALMEGIMMRGPKKSAMAVRNTKGEIVVEEFETKGTKRPAICRLPILRGLFGYFDSMVVGYKCLMRSAELSGLEDIVEESPRKKKKREAAERAKAEKEGRTIEESTVAPEAAPQKEEPAEPQAEATAEPKAKSEKPEEEKKLPSWVMTVIMVVAGVLAVVLMLGLFMYVPTKLYELLAEHVAFLRPDSLALRSLYKSVFEGVLKILLLVGYMALITLMKDIRRTFMYHGAEHKTIFCYEAGLPLTVENIRKQRRFHPRCGTSFLILMLLVSIFVSFFIDPISIAITGNVLPSLLRAVVKILLLPLIVGLGYELIKFAGRHDNLLTRIISAPGVWLQHVTVFEPTDDMIECAIEAMTRAIPEDESDNW